MDDQAIAKFRDMLPRLWWAIYQGNLAAGFDPRQSFTLTQTYVLATMSTGGCRPPDGYGPEPDQEPE